jgi:TetR/AcrR family fatty acid metabolism transcriptional regulator
VGGEVVKNTKANRHRSILAAALKIFASKGFMGASISEIGREAGVSDVTIYEYFKTKENLLFAIPEEITRKSTEATKQALTYIRGAENKIRAILLSYFNVYGNNPDYSSLVLLQLRVNQNFHKSISYDLVREPARLLTKSIQEGIENGEFQDDIDPYLIRSMFLGTLEHVFTRLRVKGSNEDVSQYLEPLLEIVFNGIRKKKAENQIAVNLNLPNNLLDFISFNKKSAEKP